MRHTGLTNMKYQLNEENKKYFHYMQSKELYHKTP